jgi:hypothetical protein
MGGFEKFVRKNRFDIVFLTVIIIIFSVYQYSIIDDMKQIPACLFGCDHYNHLGRVHHLYDGGSFFEDHATKGENPWIPSGYHFLVFTLGKFFSLEPHVAFNFITLLSGILCIFAIFLFFREVFGESVYGYIAFPLFLHSFPIFKYTDFAMFIAMPFFFYVFSRFFKKRTYQNALFVGITFGIIGVINSNAFLTLVFFIMGSFFMMFIPEVIKLKRKDINNIWKRTHKELIIPFTIITLVGLTLSMIFWFKPIFVNHMHILNIQSEYDYADLSQSGIFFSEIFMWIKQLFFRFNTLHTALLSLGALLTIVFLSTIKFKAEQKERAELLKVLFIGSAFAVFSFVIMYPLTGINLFPQRMFMFTFGIIHLMLSFYMFFILMHIFKPYRKIILSLMVILFLIVGFQNFSNHFKWMQTDGFFQTAYTELDPVRSDIQDWVKSNTNVRDVFLTTNELSFMLNGITGRKMMTFRRSHGSQFIDFNQRMMDAAVMIYGNDSSKTKELLHKYHVDYFYWDYYWFNTDYHYDEQGNIHGIFDPFVTFDIPENRAYLDRYGVSYFPKHWYIDPGVQFPKIRKYDLLFIKSATMNQSKPWSTTFDSMIEEARSVSAQGQRYASIYRINI